MIEPSAVLQQVPSQPEVRFCIHQLTARDELLLKSLIRLLSHRTHQRWVYCPQGMVDLVVLGDGLHEASQAYTSRVQSQAQQGVAALTLAIGHAPALGQPYFLYLPLHANALEQMLNQLGRMAMLRRQEAAAAQTLVATAGLQMLHFSPGQAFRLLRWPPTALLAAPQHRKLATLMAGKGQSLDVLQQRSSMERDVCEQFLQALHRLQLLEITPSVTSHPAASLSANSLPKEADNAGPLLPLGESPVHWKASLGLVARIRSRLGLPSTASRP